MTLDRLHEIAAQMELNGADMNSEPMLVLATDSYHKLRQEVMTKVGYYASMETRKEFERFPHFVIQIIGAKFFVIPGENARLKPSISVFRLDNSMVEYIQYKEHQTNSVKILLI